VDNDAYKDGYIDGWGKCGTLCDIGCGGVYRYVHTNDRQMHLKIDFGGAPLPTAMQK
jgi:hypothetical protein